MKANKCISIKEHKLLVVVAFIAFIFVSAAFYLNIIKNYNYSVYREQQSLKYSANYNRTLGFPYPSQTFVPLFHFLTLFIFLALLKTRKFLLPLFLTVFYAAVFIYGLSVSYYEGLLGGEEFSPKADFLERVYRAADGFDYLAALFISVLFLWQISILLRILIKTSQRKDVLL